MKTLLALTALAALAAPLRAEGRAGTVALGLSGGAAVPLGTTMVRDNSKLGPDYGVSVSYGLSEDLDAALSFDSVRMYKNQHTRLEPVLASLVKSFDLGRRWSPALRLGAGPVVIREAASRNVQPYTSFAVRAGGGVEYALTPSLALGGWADYLLAARASNSTKEVHAVTFGLSATWRLGVVQARTYPQRAEAAPEPAKAEAPKPMKAAPKKSQAPSMPAEAQEPPAE